MIQYNTSIHHRLLKLKGADSLGLGLYHNRLCSINEEQISLRNKREDIQEENENENELENETGT